MRRLIPVMLSLAIVVSSCSGGEDRSLTVYSGRSEDLIGPLLETFTEETGVEVEVRYGSSADLALLIQEEGDRSPADVFISQSPGAIGFLAEAGLLRPLDDSRLALVEPRFRSEAGLWIGLSGRVRVLVYNENLVDDADLPGSVEELTGEAYRGQVGVAPANGSFQDFVTAMREIEGDDATLAWLEGMAANDSPTYSNNSAIVEAVGRGEIPMGLVNHYYNFRALAENPGLPSRNHYFPEGDLGSLIIVTAMGVLESSERADVGGELIDFMLGSEAQSYYTNETFEYPLAIGSTPWEGLPDLREIGGATYDFDRLGGGLERTKELIDESGFEGS